MNVAPEFITTFGSVACEPSTTPLPLFIVSTVVASLIAAAADIVEVPVPVVNCTAPLVNCAPAERFPAMFNVPFIGLVVDKITVLYVADPGVIPVGVVPPNKIVPPLLVVKLPLVKA